MSLPWSIDDAADLTGRRAVVTGANTGLGYQTAAALAAKGCHTILACRNMDKAAEARRSIRNRYPNARVDVLTLDTGSMASVKAFVDTFCKHYDQLHILINNAGIMTTPYSQTEEGFEGQLAVNYLGHFLLTGLLLPTLEASPGARVVTLYSLAHRWGGIMFDDIHFSQGYDAGKAYCQSKMACLMFAQELDRRLRRAGYNTRSMAAHPGMSQSDLFRHLAWPWRKLSEWFGQLLFQPAEQGALPSLYAALGAELSGGEAIGPSGAGQRRGSPALVEVAKGALIQADRDRLWSMSEDMTGFTYPL